jgi:carboxypeptidase T
MERSRHSRARVGSRALGGVALAMLWSHGVAFASDPYDGHALVRVPVDAPEDVHALRALGLDLWDERPAPPAVVARVSPAQRPMLDASGIDYEVLVLDLQPYVEAEVVRLNQRPPADEAFFADFRTLEEIDARLVALADDHPDQVDLFDAGPSLEGRPILGVRIAAGEDKPALLVNAGQHAREWVSMMAGMCVAESFVTRAQEPDIAALLAEIELIVVPVVNPDGYAYSWDVDRLWRKNRRDGFGVDLNRNFGVAWGGLGSSEDPFAGDYRGEAPFSEPESVAMRELVEATPGLVSHVDLHSYGQLVLYPWGYTEEPAPADESLFTLAEALAEALGAPHGEHHTPLQGALFYPAAGTMPDWMYGQHGVHSFTFELRPDEAEPFHLGFLLPPDEILLACEETILAVEHLATWSLDRRPGMPGDDGSATTGDEGGADSTGAAEPSGSDTEAPTITAGTAATAEATDTDAEGCGCRTATSRTSIAWMLACVASMRARRRRTRPRENAAQKGMSSSPGSDGM